LPCLRCARRYRDLGQVLAHVHDAEIEMCEGLELPSHEGQAQ
jgi:hypothetical protein